MYRWVGSCQVASSRVESRHGEGKKSSRRFRMACVEQSGAGNTTGAGFPRWPFQIIAWHHHHARYRSIGISEPQTLPFRFSGGRRPSNQPARAGGSFLSFFSFLHVPFCMYFCMHFFACRITTYFFSFFFFLFLFSLFPS